MTRDALLSKLKDETDLVLEYSSACYKALSNHKTYTATERLSKQENLRYYQERLSPNIERTLSRLHDAAERGVLSTSDVEQALKASQNTKQALITYLEEAGVSSERIDKLRREFRDAPTKSIGF